MKKEKRGELTTQQIVILIILIVSFVIILFLLFRLNLGKTTQEDVCHNSVVTRGAGVLPGESIPLNCKTEYICLSKDGSCEGMTSPQIIKVRTVKEVYSALAEKMADCWWMFGEGKLNYVGKTFNEQLYCSLCSIVSFDNSLDMFDNREVSQEEFYNYLAETKMSENDITYLDYLYGLKNAQAIKETLDSGQANFGKINLNNQHFIVMGIFSDVGVWKWAGIAAGAGALIGVAFVTGGASIPFSVAIVSGAVGGGAGGYFIGTVVKGESGHDYLSPTIIEANSADYNKLKCKEIKTMA